ncbi:hypothetical protein FHT76_000979 [Rhizobium sp. BK176]|nr:hypothetical protein [Rhizobium sp. BK176]
MIVDLLLAIGFGAAGVALMRGAWRLAKADTREHRRNYPNWRAVFMGRASRHGRRSSMVFSRKRGRIEFL